MSDTRKQIVALGIVCISVAIGVLFQHWAAGLGAFGLCAIMAATAPKEFR